MCPKDFSNGTKKPIFGKPRIYRHLRLSEKIFGTHVRVMKWSSRYVRIVAAASFTHMDTTIETPVPWDEMTPGND